MIVVVITEIVKAETMPNNHLKNKLMIKSDFPHHMA